jgi:hypothetical protein
MAIKGKSPSGSGLEARTRAVRDQLNATARERDAAAPDRIKEKMESVSFQIKPSEYAALKVVFDQLGLGTGAGLRFALREFLRNRGAR